MCVAGNKQVEVRRLQSDDDCNPFCLNEREDQALATFLQNDAKKLHEQMVTKTHVVADGKKILAYVSVTCTEISLKNEEGKAVKKVTKLAPVLKELEYRVRCLPGVRLARLASDKNHRGKNYRYGDKLIKLVTRLAHDISEECGCRFILLDAVKDKINYYKEHGFELINTDANLAKNYPTMFLDLENK